jgi:phosphomannomutase
VISDSKVTESRKFRGFRFRHKKANDVDGEVFIAMDIDADRMAIAARNGKGIFAKCTGSWAGAGPAEFRLSPMKALDWISAECSPRVAFIKTFVISLFKIKAPEKMASNILISSRGSNGLAKN